MYTFYLLFNRTVYIIGLDIIFALLFNIILTIYVYPYFNPSIWFTLFKNNLINSYVLSFFVCTYLIGLFLYLKDKKNFKFNYLNFVQSFNRKKEPKKGYYTYDNETKQYNFHDD